MLSSAFLAAGFVVLVWWASTGLVLYLDGLPASSYTVTYRLAGLLFGLSAWGVWATLDTLATPQVYCAFTCAVGLWAFVEVSYLTNQITGPEKRPCPPDCRGWQRFVRALRTSLYHELLIVAVGGALMIVSFQAANQTALHTYLVLWLMRWSAKLNIFFGVRNLNEEWLPEHLRYLLTYMRKRPINPFFPVSVLLATGAAALVCRATQSSETVGVQVGGLLVVTLLTLALLEHWLLVLPLDATRLWAWGMKSRAERE